MKNILSFYLASFVLVLGFSIINVAQTSPNDKKFPNVKIGNFGQMDERYYRGAQPNLDDYQTLKDLGVNTVIDLRNDPTDYEKAKVESLGMKYVNIPMSGWRYPKDKYINEFKRLMNDPETGVMFVHCKAGIHRTGITAAIYRAENYGWDYDKAYKEMKNYNFSWWMVHYQLKAFVKDYYKDFEKRRDNLAQNKKVVTENN